GPAHADRAGPALRLGVLAFQVGGGLVGEQGGDLAGQLAEGLGAVVGAAHLAELVLDQRVLDFDDLHGGLRLGIWGSLHQSHRPDKEEAGWRRLLRYRGARRAQNAQRSTTW